MALGHGTLCKLQSLVIRGTVVVTDVEVFVDIMKRIVTT